MSTRNTFGFARPSHDVAQRCFDLAIAAFALLVFAPIMTIVATAIAFESGFPVLFRQARIGIGGRPFEMYKFRKFSRSCSGPALTKADDSRFTKVGKFLAKTKLDELPQFWNVLTGDMAIVGPRPETFEFSGCYTGGYEEALQYKPGVVGPSQVFFRDEASHYPEGGDPCQFYREVIFPIKAGLDIAYCRRRTIASDVVWLWRSALAVFGRTPWKSSVRAI